MARHTLSYIVAFAYASYVTAQGLPTIAITPLASMNYAYSALPEQVVSVTYIRGTQTGYNICNSTTQNQQSQCQTAIINNISDFCLFAPPNPNSTIGDSEGFEVTWCTQPHGARLIPANTFTGIQVLKNPHFMQIVAFANQVNIDINAQDFGGELDPHGQDLNGNPIGAMMYSNHFSSDNVTLEQVHEWNMFLGGNITAAKICNDADGPAESAGWCRNTLDRLGVSYNMPNNAQDGVFEVCDSDPGEMPGVYTSNGQVITYTQPAESLGPITTVPYTPVVPSSSNCQTYQSSDLFPNLPTITSSGASSATPTPTGSGGSRTSSGSPASSTTGSNGASAVTISLLSTILGVGVSVMFLA
jgi:hypothetical protein